MVKQSNIKIAHAYDDKETTQNTQVYAGGSCQTYRMYAEFHINMGKRKVPSLP